MKRFALLLALLAALALSLCGCGGEAPQIAPTAEPDTMASAGVPPEADISPEADVPSEADVPPKTDALAQSLELTDGYGYGEFLTLAATAEADGDACAGKGLALQAYTFYAASATELGSLRLGIEHIIAAKTGALTEDVFEGSLFTSWEELAALFPASPYPDYFEGLSLMAFGEEDAATACWTNAAANAAYPEEGLALTALLDMSAEELLALRDALRAKENALFAKYEPQLFELERSPKNSYIEYLLGMVRESLAEENYGEAMEYARAAVLTEPFSGDCFAAAALCALVGSDQKEMAYYINEGLLIDPEHEGLNTLLEAYGHGGEEVETNE